MKEEEEKEKQIHRNRHFVIFCGPLSLDLIIILNYAEPRGDHMKTVWLSCSSTVTIKIYVFVLCSIYILSCGL